MKVKFLIGASMCLLMFLGVIQPIFAESTVHQTCISIYTNNYFENINETGDYMFFNHSKINLKFYLGDTYGVRHGEDYDNLGWRNINLKVYNTNGTQEYNDSRLTGWLGGPICVELNLVPGDYILEATYDGNNRDHLSPCKRIVNLHVNEN